MFSALIIDADGKTPATIKSILAPYGFEFTITENGPEAVNVARQAAPDIILLRAELPLTSGFSVCNRLRRHEDTRRIPLVMYSSNVSEDVFEQHRNLKTHADNYLRLPLDGDRLVSALRPLLSLPEPGRAGAAPDKPAGGRPGRLDVELTEVAPPARPAEPRSQFEQEFADGFRALQDEETAPAGPPQMARPPEPGGPLPDGETSDASMSAGGFRAQREVLQLKAQLNARARELLALKDELEARERMLLDAKKHQREMQAQIGELEQQLLSSQEQILSARETAESAQRDKQTVLKREEGTKTRLDATSKKLREVEQELSALRTTSTQHADKTAREYADAQKQISAQAALIADIETARDGLETQLTEANRKLAELADGFEGARKQVTSLEDQLARLRQESEQALADVRAERAAAIDGLSRQHQAELDEREQDHRSTVDRLQAQIAELNDQSAQERERVSQALMETEENARLQIAQLTQTLTSTEETAQREIEQLQQALAAAEDGARNEIAALHAGLADAKAQAEDAATEAARRISGLEDQIDELSSSLDQAQSALHRRRDAAQRAQQALAIALRILEEGEPA